MTSGFNPHLAPWRSAAASEEPAQGDLGGADISDNIPWQTRPAEPAEYEMSLALALEQLFSEGVQAPELIVAGLNQAGLRTAAGALWTEDAFFAEIRRLGA